MSNDPTKGITNAAYRDVIKAALKGGWEFIGMTKTTHGKIRWPETGDIVSFGTTPSSTAFRAKAAEIEKISGVVCWKPPQRGRSRKKDQHTDFTMERCNYEQGNPFAQAQKERKERLEREHHELIAEFRELRETGDNRTVIDQARKILHRIMEIEKGLDNLHHPYQRFDAASV